MYSLILKYVILENSLRKKFIKEKAMLIQMTGSVLILIVFALNQFQVISSTNKLYLLGNILGSACLAYDAFHNQQWGFVILEAIWTLVSLISLIRELLKKG